MAELYLVGEGELLAEVRRSSRHGPQFRSLVDRTPAGGDVLISAHDEWRALEVRDLQNYARAHDLRYLPARLDGALGLLGPLVQPRVRGCAVCAEARRREVAQLPAADFVRSGDGGPVVPPRPVLAGLVAVLDQMVDRLLAGQPAGPLPVDGDAAQVYVLRWTDLIGAWHTTVPVQNCPECVPLPEDSANSARMTLRPRLQHRPEDFRERTLTLGTAELRATLMDWRYGLIHHVYKAQNAGLALVGAEFRAPGYTFTESGWGRGSEFAGAETVAFLEALERFCSQAPRGKRTSVRASARDLGDQALELRRLGEVSPAALRHPGYRYAPFDQDVAVNWVWGHSFARQAPLLVPEHVAYYQHDALPRHERFLYESSNGCALGGSLEEATLYGLLEVIERDAFLLAWHARRPAQEIDLASCDDPLTQHLLRRAESLGFRAHAYDITTEFGVPAIWTLLVNGREGYPRALSAAGAHFDPVKALRGGLIEVVVNAFVHRRDDAHTEEALQAMLRDPSLVRTLDDHVAVNAHPDAFSRLDFLLDRPVVARPLGELFPDWRRTWLNPDLSVVLERLVARVLNEGLDVVVVDQTPELVAELGFAQVKVIVPGSLPMTFGHLNQRFGGLHRLTTVPDRLNFPNPAPSLHFPHPFP